MHGSWTIPALVIANLALQLFDGVATYLGWERHGELNPILRAGFELWGAGPTLLVAKGAAVAFVLTLARTPRRSLAAFGLALTMSAYLALSFVPWAVRLMAV